MAKLGKISEDTADKKSVAELKNEYAAVKEELKKLLQAKADRTELTEKDKAKFREKYLEAARLAQSLSSRVVSDEDARAYRDDYEKLSEAAQSFGSLIKGKIPKTTFDDVKGLKEVKGLIKNFVFLAKNEDLIRYYKLDGGLGVLMYGPPGTGKTMVAEAIANAMNLPLFVVTPADIYKSYVGESEQAVRAIFQEIEACPDGAILFVDECESIFSRRNQDTKDYKAAVTTELLQRMNGFGVNGSKRIMIAATNRPDQIDPAYLRYKRFSHQLYVTLPDEEAVDAILKSKLEGIALEGVSVSDVLEMAVRPRAECDASGNTVRFGKPLYSAADLCGIVEQACRFAVTELERTNGKNPIPLTRKMFEDAFRSNPPRLTESDLKLYENFKLENAF